MDPDTTLKIYLHCAAMSGVILSITYLIGPLPGIIIGLMINEVILLIKQPIIMDL